MSKQISKTSKPWHVRFGSVMWFGVRLLCLLSVSLTEFSIDSYKTDLSQFPVDSLSLSHFYYFVKLNFLIKEMNNKTCCNFMKGKIGLCTAYKFDCNFLLLEVTQLCLCVPQLITTLNSLQWLRQFTKSILCLAQKRIQVCSNSTGSTNL
jgi:hypothetical protein